MFQRVARRGSVSESPHERATEAACAVPGVLAVRPVGAWLCAAARPRAR